MNKLIKAIKLAHSIKNRPLYVEKRGNGYVWSINEDTNYFSYQRALDLIYTKSRFIFYFLKWIKYI